MEAPVPRKSGNHAREAAAAVSVLMTTAILLGARACAHPTPLHNLLVQVATLHFLVVRTNCGGS